MYDVCIHVYVHTVQSWDSSYGIRSYLLASLSIMYLHHLQSSSNTVASFVGLLNPLSPCHLTGAITSEDTDGGEQNERRGLLWWESGTVSTYSLSG